MVLALSGRDERDLRAVPPIHLVFAGLIVLTAVANMWAFFAPVGRTIDLLMLIGSLIVLVVHRRRATDYVEHWWNTVRSWKWPVLLALVGLITIALLKSASLSRMYDEGAYYMPYIKWIEQYRIIPGLGNIEDRLGFNSAFHMSSALFGLAWLVPDGLYDLNGFLLLFFGGWCLGGVSRILTTRKPAMSDVMKVFGLFFLMRNMIAASSSDFSNILLGETILILFMEKIEQGRVERSDRTYMLIGLYCLMIATIKLSSLSIWLVPLYLIVRMLLAHVRPRFGMVIVCGILVLVPWAARFPILSGYLVYPIYQIDLFDVDWKVPHHVAERQYYYVGEWAKTNAKPELSIHLAKHRGLTEWVPLWFARENGFNKAIALAMLLSLLVLLPYTLIHARTLWRGHRERSMFGLIVVANVLFWFLRNPAFRFGWAWSIMLLAFVFHLALVRFAEGRVLRWAALGLLGYFLTQGTIKSVVESRPYFARMIVHPFPVKQPDLRPVEIGAVHARVSSTIQCFGADPPCLPLGYDPRLQARGPRVEDGFRIASKP